MTIKQQPIELPQKTLYIIKGLINPIDLIYSVEVVLDSWFNLSNKNSESCWIGKYSQFLYMLLPIFLKSDKPTSLSNIAVLDNLYSLARDDVLVYDYIRNLPGNNLIIKQNNHNWFVMVLPDFDILFQDIIRGDFTNSLKTARMLKAVNLIEKRIISTQSCGEDVKKIIKV